jgi:ankyrin repeat protein
MSEANALTAKELYQEAIKNDHNNENKYDLQKLMKANASGIENVAYEAIQIAHREFDDKAKIYISYGYPRTDGDLKNCNDFYYRAVTSGDIKLARFIGGCEILLLDAINNDNDKKIKLLLNSGQSIDKALNTAVVRSEYSDNIQLVLKLLSMGANPNLVNFLRPPVFWYIRDGKLDNVKALVSRGARLDIRDTDNRDALKFAEEWKSKYREWMEDAQKKGNNKEYRKNQMKLEGITNVIPFVQQELAKQSKAVNSSASDEHPLNTYSSQEQTRAISSREQRACETQKKSCYATCEGFSSKSPAIGLDSPKENCRDECRDIYCGNF